MQLVQCLPSVPSVTTQVVHYERTQQYKPHYDWFSPDDARHAEKTSERGNRLLSFFAYLTDGVDGGRTSFPKLGASFAPECGCDLPPANCFVHLGELFW